MISYIIKDLTEALYYLPYGLIMGLLITLLLRSWNHRRMKHDQEPFAVVSLTGFLTYLAIILAITLWSRESSSSAKVDMQLFATLGINMRNNALVIENILLFIPFGVLCPMVIHSARKLGRTAYLGLLVSVAVELLQLITGRGYFQIDDMWTNTLGAVIGYLVWAGMQIF